MGSLSPAIRDEVATRKSRERTLGLLERIDREVAEALGQPYAPRPAPEAPELEPEAVTDPGVRP